MRKTIPQLEPEVVRAEADKLRHGDDQKCATTSIKELRVRDVRITSRYQKADKLGSRSPRIFSFDLRFDLRLAADAHAREASRHAPLLLTTLLGVPSMTRLDHAAEAGLHGWWCPVLDQGNGFTVAALGSVGTNRHPGDEGGTMKSALFAPLAIACWLLVPAPPSRAQQVRPVFSPWESGPAPWRSAISTGMASPTWRWQIPEVRATRSRSSWGPAREGSHRAPPFPWETAHAPSPSGTSTGTASRTLR